nr:NADH dehydrogenase subunit 6 [Cyamus boopis]
MFMSFLVLLFLFMTHPLMLSFTLMLTSLIIGLSISVVGSSSWLAYMLVMVFVSGMMIIILYMSSLSSNEPLLLTSSSKTLYLLFFLISVPFTLTSSLTGPDFKALNKFFTDPMFAIVHKTYSNMLSPLTLLMIFYLLIVLITAVNIVNVGKLPLKSG